MGSRCQYPFSVCGGTRVHILPTRKPGTTHYILYASATIVLRSDQPASPRERRTPLRGIAGYRNFRYAREAAFGKLGP